MIGWSQRFVAMLSLLYGILSTSTRTISQYQSLWDQLGQDRLHMCASMMAYAVAATGVGLPRTTVKKLFQQAIPE